MSGFPITCDDDSGQDYPDVRKPLYASDVASVTLISRSQPNAPERGYADECEIVIPYGGVFLWRVGARTTAVDSNCALFISEGQEFSEAHPVADRGHAAAVIAPGRNTLEELKTLADREALDGFRTLVAPASPRTQMLASLLLHWSTQADPFRDDEAVIALLSDVLLTCPPRRSAAREIVTRAKALLQDWVGAEFSLADAASELRVTPAHLTHAFKLVEGVPLYAYFQRLRLARALQSVPYCDSLTEVALDLGFSSHSHFSAAFRQCFGLTPTEYKRMARPTVQVAKGQPAPSHEEKQSKEDMRSVSSASDRSPSTP